MITIVICTHNRSDLLFKAIDSLNRANRPVSLPAEILVIANACNDSTIDDLEHYLQTRTDKQLPLSYQVEPIAGKSYALNRAIKLIKEGFLCFIDDDQKADESFFTEIELAIESHKDIKMFCGKLLPDWTGKEPEWIHEMGQYKIYPFPIPIFDLGSCSVQVTADTAHPPGGNLFIHHSIFETVGEFSTELGPEGHNLAGSEDSDFIYRALHADIPICYIPEIIQYHYVDEARLKFSFLVKMSYQRTRTLTQLKVNQTQSIPRYLWRKLAEYIFQAIFSLSCQKTRFFSMRIASTLGEIAGFVGSKRS